MQGDIESTAAKQPKDLTAMFEAISGSEGLRKDYDAAQAEMTAAETRMNLITSRKRVIGQEKRQKKEQKEEAERHLRLQQELVSTARHAPLRPLHLLRSWSQPLLRRTDRGFWAVYSA